MTLDESLSESLKRGWRTAPLDERERAMLGDTGANVLGAMAGLWLVLSLDATGEWIALAIMLALNVYGELHSISTAVERIAPLRALDLLGRPK